ncbi:MAG: MBL fold metallo-hydrolase [Planctomycetota bacterium]|jgi:ribonuclease Z
MLPKAPPRTGQVGFLYVPPYRVQGISVAGEQTIVQVPELDVSFDIGMCPRIALSSPYVALSHGHMDHVGGLPYYFSQRMFQRMGVGTCVCHPALADPVRTMMRSWAALEGQRTPYEIVPLRPDEQLEVKNNIFLRAMEVSHAVGAMGYAIVERRSKLKTDYFDLPQEELRTLKNRGVEITRSLEIPLVAYTGDTEFGPYLFRDEFAEAKIVVCECTFFEPDHESRARVGKHLHVQDLAKLLHVWKADAVVLVHLSRRTNLAAARAHLTSVLGEDLSARLHFLMDHRANRQRYERQELAVTA